MAELFLPAGFCLFFVCWIHDIVASMLCLGQWRVISDVTVSPAQEAVRRGVVHAKAGEYDAAQACYKQALDLDRRNSDAWVAAGAAHANRGEFPQAVSHFRTALGIPQLPWHLTLWLPSTCSLMSSVLMTCTYDVDDYADVFPGCKRCIAS